MTSKQKHQDLSSKNRQHYFRDLQSEKRANYDLNILTDDLISARGAATNGAIQINTRRCTKYKQKEHT